MNRLCLCLIVRCISFSVEYIKMPYLNFSAILVSLNPFIHELTLLREDNATSCLKSPIMPQALYYMQHSPTCT